MFGSPTAAASSPRHKIVDEALSSSCTPSRSSFEPSYNPRSPSGFTDDGGDLSDVEFDNGGFSDDGGMTWNGFGPVPSLPDPGCKGSLIGWPSRKSLVFINPASEKLRVNTTVRLSRDDGASWSGGTVVSTPQSGGYGDIAISRNGAGEWVVALYENITDEKVARCSISAALLEPE